MAYKCPLCLKSLDENDQLVRYCTKHNRHRIFNGNRETIKENLLCSEDNCRANLVVPDGIYLCHRNCQLYVDREGKPIFVTHPFWSDDEFKLPENITGQQMVLPERGETIVFTHWEISMLTRVPREYDNSERQKTNIRQMWFPAMLLRATLETPPDEPKRFGSLVALAGTIEAGKTVLAMQMLDREGYLGRGIPGNIDIENYIYYSSIDPFYRALALRYLMLFNKPNIRLPAKTTPNSWNLHTIFFKPAKLIAEVQPEIVEETQPVRTVEQDESKSLFGRFWKKFTAQFRKDAGQFTDNQQSVKAEDNRSESPYRYTLALYDYAGEDNQSRPDWVKRIEDQADKVAIVIDSLSLLEQGDVESLNLAIQRIADLTEKDANFCFVFTKLDALIEKLVERRMSAGKITSSFISAHSNQLINKSQDDAEVFLEDLLNISPFNQKQELIERIAGKKVFFIGHWYLPKDGEAVIRQPETTGLKPFVCWCLDIKWENLCQTRSSAKIK